MEKKVEIEIIEEKVDIEADTEDKPVEEIPEEKEIEKQIPEGTFDTEGWHPKTTLGRSVKEGTISDVEDLLDSGKKILESTIVDALLPNMTTELLFVGQSKGKFGGGQKRVFKQTQKKTQEGNKPKFATMAVVGNKDGIVGIGYGKSKETVPGREKAIRKAKLNIIKIRRGCGSWECKCGEPHSIPFQVEGKCSSVEIKLMPAPKGTGLCIESECAKILELAGIKDVWSKTKGQTKTKSNLIKACFAALKELMKVKVPHNFEKDHNIIEGRIANNAGDQE